MSEYGSEVDGRDAGPTARLPWDPGCFLCGVDQGRLGIVWEVSGQEVSARVPVRVLPPGHEGGASRGVLAGILDESLAWAVALSCQRYVFTTRIVIRWLAPPPAAGLLRVRAWSRGPCRRLVRAAGSLEGEGSSLAEATGLYLLRGAEESLAIDAGFRYPPGARDVLAQLRTQRPQGHQPTIE